MATMSQLLSLKDNELDLLAQFMGHDIRTHRHFYRLPEDTLQLAKLSKLFLLMEQGTVKNLSGRTLDNVLLEVEAGWFVCVILLKYLKVRLDVNVLYNSSRACGLTVTAR